MVSFLSTMKPGTTIVGNMNSNHTSIASVGEIDNELLNKPIKQKPTHIITTTTTTTTTTTNTTTTTTTSTQNAPPPAAAPLSETIDDIAKYHNNHPHGTSENLTARFLSSLRKMFSGYRHQHQGSSIAATNSTHNTSSHSRSHSHSSHVSNHSIRSNGSNGSGGHTGNTTANTNANGRISNHRNSILINHNTSNTNMNTNMNTNTNTNTSAHNLTGSIRSQYSTTIHNNSNNNMNMNLIGVTNAHVVQTSVDNVNNNNNNNPHNTNHIIDTIHKSHHQDVSGIFGVPSVSKHHPGVLIPMPVSSSVLGSGVIVENEAGNDGLHSGSMMTVTTSTMNTMNTIHSTTAHSPSLPIIK